MKKRKITPYLTIILSFLAVIFIGTILLALPIATADGKSMGLVDSLFMVTSGVCVTGLTVIPNPGEDLSIFGKVVLIILVEIGGLSILTITVFIFIVLGVKLGVSNRFLMREALNQNTAKGIIKLIKRIVIITLVIQIIGSCLSFMVFIKYYEPLEAIGVSIFHSIASFNNAGFDILGYNNSLVNFKDNVLLNLTTMFLIVVGGIGFIVIFDIAEKRRWGKLALHSKIVLTSTFVLIVAGTLLYKLSVSDMTWLQAAFQSITTRTAGFQSYDFSQIDKSNPGYVLSLVLMFIGTSPCSTGGGVKTTALFVVIFATLYFARGKSLKVFNRRISDQIVFKAFSLITISVGYVVLIVMCISFLEPRFSVSQITFEVVSAFSTTGLSMGITSSLSVGSKLLISLTMFFGRLGPLTIMNVLNKNWMKDTKDEIRYVEEKVVIG